MKVCIIGNIESIHIQRWCQYFSNKDHEVHLIYFTESQGKKDVLSIFPNADNSNIMFHHMKTITFNDRPIKPFFNFFNMLSNDHLRIRIHKVYLDKIIDNIKPDIIHGHYLERYGYWATKSGVRPLVLTAWGSDIIFAESKTQLKNLKYMFNKTDLIHTGDTEGRMRLIEFGCDPDKIFIQPWGINTNRFKPSAKEDELRKKIIDDEDGCIITIVRSLKEVYDIPTLIKAASVIVKKGSDVKFLVIGEGKEKENLKMMAKELSISDNIIFKGAIPNDQLHTYLASSDIYVDTPHPTKGGGGIGVALMEAMSSGLPCVVAKRPGAESGVLDGENGYVFEGGNYEELAEKLLTLIENNDARIEFGEKGRAIALEIGDWDKNMKIFEDKYLKLIEKLNA